MNIDESVTQTIEDVGKKYSLAVVEKLIKAIEEDEQITSSCSLSSRALRDNLPEICQTIIKAVISPTLDIERSNFSLFSLDQPGQGTKHGYVRSTQDFNLEELVREFSLLKQISIEEIKPYLLTCSPEQIIKKLTSIDLVIDRIMENSFQSYAMARKRQLDDLRQQVFLTKQELTRLIAAHQESLSYLVHEIKNPLTSIIGYSDLFLRQQQDDSIDNIGHIRQVLQQGRKVLRLVNDTSEISAYKKGSFKVRPREVDICSLLENITLCLKPSVEAKQLHLVTSCAPEQLVVNSDSLRLQQIITNLLINAIRYTKVGKIELSCRIIDMGLLEIRVADTGIGISQQEQQRIFEPYFRGQQSEDNAPDGVGLGLAIVAQLVNTLQGKIELNSELDRGSVFIVTIPFDY